MPLRFSPYAPYLPLPHGGHYLLCASTTHATPTYALVPFWFLAYLILFLQQPSPTYPSSTSTLTIDRVPTPPSCPSRYLPPRRATTAAARGHSNSALPAARAPRMRVPGVVMVRHHFSLYLPHFCAGSARTLPRICGVAAFLALACCCCTAFALPVGWFGRARYIHIAHYQLPTPAFFCSVFYHHPRLLPASARGGAAATAWRRLPIPWHYLLAVPALLLPSATRDYAFTRDAHYTTIVPSPDRFRATT